MAKDRSFILFTYILYGHLNRIGGQKKSNCLNVLLSLLKYAWKKNNYKCAVRYSTIMKDTGLAKITIRRCVHTLEKLNVVKIRRLSSANEYVINEVFLRAERYSDSTNKITQGYIKDHSGVSLKSSINKRNNIKEIKAIEDIINKGLSKEDTIKELSTLPCQTLNEDKRNPYYVKLALKLKEYNEQPKVELNTGGILKDMAKQKNPQYAMKKSYNIRNNLDWKGRPKE